MVRLKTWPLLPGDGSRDMALHGRAVSQKQVLDQREAVTATRVMPPGTSKSATRGAEAGIAH
jgi:hypothetical protein